MEKERVSVLERSGSAGLHLALTLFTGKSLEDRMGIGRKAWSNGLLLLTKPCLQDLLHGFTCIEKGAQVSFWLCQEKQARKNWQRLLRGPRYLERGDLQCQDRDHAP